MARIFSGLNLPDIAVRGQGVAASEDLKYTAADDYSMAGVMDSVLRAEGSDADAGSGGLYRKAGKRALDILASIVLLVMIAPLMAFIGLIVALDGGRPIYSHWRVGLGGRRFRCHKFRSMVLDAEARLNELLACDPAAAEEWARDQKLTKDPRVTRFGAFLRKSSLDELPQLVNVLRGEMSLVGPRPVTEKELERYGVFARHYLSVKPGITGLWQVSGRNNLDYGERVRLDARYAMSRSFPGDAFILFLTTLTVLQMNGK